MSALEQPLVTFVVPCYNSAGYMSNAVDSLLEANHYCEILLINDGSSDDTSKIAHAYSDRFGNIRAVDQENSNWGGAINTALKLARGRYFKILDSDDRMEPQALNRVLDALAAAVRWGSGPDLLVTNYTYDHLNTETTRTMSYESFLPKDYPFGWDAVGKPGRAVYIMIHAMWFATDVLRESGVQLPTGAPYMDSILLLHPLPYVKTLYYLDVSPYQYAIGREGQSVDVEVLRKHINEQLFVTKLAIDDTDYGALATSNPQCAELMMGYVACMMCVSMLNLFTINTPEAIKKNDELWEYLEQQSPELYDYVSHSWVGRLNCKSAAGRFLAVRAFNVGKKFFKLA